MAAESALVLTISMERIDETFTVVVPTYAGIAVPLRGVLPTGNNFYANSSAAAGPVSFFRDFTCQGVGTFLVDPQLRLTGSLAGGPTSIVITFALYLPLEIDDALQIKLPEFGGAEKISFAVESNIGIITRWIENTLIFLLTERVPAWFATQITVPVTAGLTIPPDGILSDSSSLSVTVNSKDGPIRNYPVINNGVGSFTFSRVEFFPGIAGASN